MGANTKFKDSVFSSIFSDPDVLRELYCALEGITLGPDIPVTINTLKDVLFMDRINDISFEIGNKLIVLVEHQSTINPNITLRLLMYIARVYEKIIGDKSLYTSRLVTLPNPEFFVLYNGTSPYPPETILKLSDAFENLESLGLGKRILNLELTAKVININYGINEKITSRSETLNGYSIFVQKVREYTKESKDLKTGMKEAIKYCLEKNILRKFLEENATEVMNMLMTEWNWDDALTVRYEEGREDGLEIGLQEGWEKGRRETAKNFKTNGVSIEIIVQATGLSPEEIANL